MSIHVEQISPNDRQSFRLLRWRDNLEDVEQCDGEGRVSHVKGAGERWHLHREMELAFIESGSGTRVVGDHIAPFHGPELVLLGPHLPHCWHGLRRSTGFALQFHWALDHPLRSVPEFAALRALWQRSGRGLLFPAAVCDTVRGYFHELARASTPTRLGLLFAILGELSTVRDRQLAELSRLEFGVRDGAPHQQGIERVIRRVLERYAEPHSMEAVLKLAGMSKATFARQFPRYTGCTFTEFLARVRLDHARQRILTGQQSISDAAFAVGFNHLSHFNRFYRRTFGHTPTQDRAGAS